MSCTRHFLNVRWPHHSWRRRVSAAEILTGTESNMWARDVVHEYVRCDKQDVCDVCGATRRKVSCVCDLTRGEQCTLLREWMAESGQTPASS